MLLDLIKKRWNAISQIGAEAAERAAALGIEPVNVVYPEPKAHPSGGRMPDRLDGIAEQAAPPSRSIGQNSKR